MQEIIDVLYENFLIIFIYLIACVVIMFFLMLGLFRNRIKTRLYIVKQNTLEVMNVKESPDGKDLRAKGRIVIRKHEPIILKEKFTIYRCFFNLEGTEQTCSIRDSPTKGINADTVAWNVIFESEAIRQSMAALIAEERKLWFIIIGAIVITALIIFIVTKVM